MESRHVITAARQQASAPCLMQDKPGLRILLDDKGPVLLAVGLWHGLRALLCWVQPLHDPIADDRPQDRRGTVAGHPGHGLGSRGRLLQHHLERLPLLHLARPTGDGRGGRFPWLVELWPDARVRRTPDQGFSSLLRCFALVA